MPDPSAWASQDTRNQFSYLGIGRGLTEAGAVTVLVVTIGVIDRQEQRLDSLALPRLKSAGGMLRSSICAGTSIARFAPGSTNTVVVVVVVVVLSLSLARKLRARLEKENLR